MDAIVDSEDEFNTPATSLEIYQGSELSAGQGLCKSDGALCSDYRGAVTVAVAVVLLLLLIRILRKKRYLLTLKASIVEQWERLVTTLELTDIVDDVRSQERNKILDEYVDIESDDTDAPLALETFS